MRFIRPRLRKPAGIALFGTVYAAAWLVHGGNGWQWAITAEIGVIAFTIAAYLRGGRDSDEDALYGSRIDDASSLSPSGRGPWPGRSPCSPRSPA
jgi:hypothetical protein